MANLTDVDVDGVANGDVLKYNSSTQKWEGKSISSGTNEIIAPVEGATSLHAYVVGEQLIYNNTLYKVIAPIAVNDALVVDTNIEVSNKTVIEQVEDNAEGIEELNDAWKKNGAYNICPNIVNTQVINGVTVTVNSNKTITLNGTANAFTVINISGNILSLLDHDTTYRLVGAPANASTSSFYIYMGYQPGNSSLGVDDGNGVNFSLSQTQVTYTSVACYLVIMQGTSFSNNVIKPMITTDLNVTYDDFVEYAMTNRELTEVKTITGVSVTSTAYSLVSADVRRVGNIVQLYFSINIPNGLTAGANADGTLSGLPLPLMNCQGNTFTSTRNVGWLIQPDGLLRIRAVDTLLTNEYVAVAATYICK